jgi:hypothetical protein
MTEAYHEFQVPFSDVANNIQSTISIFFAWEERPLVSKRWGDAKPVSQSVGSKLKWALTILE